MVPRRRDGIGAVTSSIRTVSAEPSQAIALGPMARFRASRVSASRPRSVIAQRFPPRP
jgi:hypothetical protein